MWFPFLFLSETLTQLSDLDFITQDKPTSAHDDEMTWNIFFSIVHPRKQSTLNVSRKLNVLLNVLIR